MGGKSEAVSQAERYNDGEIYGLGDTINRNQAHVCDEASNRA